MWLFGPPSLGQDPEGPLEMQGDGARVHFRPSASGCTRLLRSKVEREASISILSGEFLCVRCVFGGESGSWHWWVGGSVRANRAYRVCMRL